MSVFRSSTRFRQFALGGLALNLFVIVWGAFVRATGSGAGCGSHWPLCNGEVIPQIAQLHTLIEFIHRTTSGLSLVFAVGLYLWSRRLYVSRHPVRMAAGWTLNFTLSEALIGAGLVLFELVAHDRSAARAFSISLHLMNTLLLVASLVLTARWASSGVEAPKRPWDRKLTFWIFGMAGTFAVLGITGALTALGDTLFKSASLTQGMAQDFAEGSHFLVKLRVAHPFVAVTTAALFFVFSEACQRVHDSEEVRKWARRVQAIVGVQVLVGAINLGLLAPTALQLVHLLIANALWISFVMLASAALEPETVPQLQSSGAAGLLPTTSSIL